MVTERDIRTEQTRDAIGFSIRFWDKHFPRLQATREAFNVAVSESQNPKGEK